MINALSPSIVPASRLFAAPRTAFDTERTVLRVANVSTEDDRLAEVTWISSEELVEAPLVALVGGAPSVRGEVLARHLLARFSASVVPAPARRTIMVESLAVANEMDATLALAGLTRIDEIFFGVDARVLAASGARLQLDALVGDDAWHRFACVEQEVLADAIAPSIVTNSFVERAIAFKRRQQRGSPPIRRFVGCLEDGRAIATIGYAPFTACDLGFATPGVLVRTRDVAVIAAERCRGRGRALLRALAARAIEECGATQVLICGAEGPPARLYRSIGAREIARCVTFRTRA